MYANMGPDQQYIRAQALRNTRTSALLAGCRFSSFTKCKRLVIARTSALQNLRGDVHCWRENTLGLASPMAINRKPSVNWKENPGPASFGGQRGGECSQRLRATQRESFGYARGATPLERRRRRKKKLLACQCAQNWSQNMCSVSSFARRVQKVKRARTSHTKWQIHFVWETR